MARGYRTTVTVRRLDYEGGNLGPAVALSPQPTETPYTPFLSAFNGELAVCFTDSRPRPTCSRSGWCDSTARGSTT